MGTPSRTKEKLISWGPVILLLLLAFGLRLNFVLRHHQVPVVWDAAGYNIQAREFYRAWLSLPDRAEFMRHFKKAYEMALFKCELYPLFLSAVYGAAGIDFDNPHSAGRAFPSARAAQAGLGTLSCFLLYLIAVKIFNRPVALFSLLVSAFYVPLILSEGRLLTETLAIFVLLLANYLLVLSLEKGRWWLLFLAGLATALLVISRTLFQFIFVFYWLLLLAGLRVRKFRWFFPRSLVFLLGLAVIIVPRLFWTPRVDKAGRHLLSGSWRNGLAMYCGIYPPNRGLQTTADPGGEILGRVQQEFGRRSADDNYFRAYLLILWRRPLAAARVILAKGWLFWQRPYNDFLQSYLLGPAGITVFSRVILFLGLLGLGLLFGIGPPAWPFLFSALYIWAVCFLADAESRYALPALPFMIAAAGWFLDRAGRGILALREAGRPARFRLAASLAGSLILLGLALAGRPPFLLAGVKGLSFLFAHRLRVVLFSLFFVSLGPLLLGLYRPTGRGWRRLAAALLPPALILLVYLAALGVHPGWHQWRTRLAFRGEGVEQTIFLPDGIEKYRSAELKIDMRSGPGRMYDLVVAVDGEEVRRFERGLTPDSWIPPDKRRAFPIYLREQGRKLAEINQWFTVPLDITKLKGKTEIRVKIAFHPLVESPGNQVEIFGDYPFSDDPLFSQGPTFSRSPSRLSLYKYLYDDDWRIWEETELKGPVASRRIVPGGAGSDDLSVFPGKQTGRYRIFLLLSGRAPPSSSFPVAVRSDEYLTKKTHRADYYSLQIWAVNPWKRSSDRMLLEAAHAAPGEEGGFWLVVYSDTDGDGQPDRLIEKSSFFTAEKAGEWSSWEFTADEQNLFVGMSWPRGSPTLVYYERLLWPHDIFPEVMFYKTGPSAATAYPVLTNLRITFLEGKPEGR